VLDFVDYKYDVLVATTIIENGIDIPRANTIIINRADNYGLSQLYQLRGRVGRSNRRAYAYLLIPGEFELTPIARRRFRRFVNFPIWARAFASPRSIWNCAAREIFWAVSNRGSSTRSDLIFTRKCSNARFRN
jgi:superfamily II DNA or RNA helicase